jgi:hypothetical protein
VAKPMRAQLDHSAGRTLAALVGALFAALALGVALAYVVPAPVTERYLIGSVAVLPTWAALCTWLFIAPSGKRAWLRVGALIVAALLAIAIVRGVLGNPFAPKAQSARRT